MSLLHTNRKPPTCMVVFWGVNFSPVPTVSCWLRFTHTWNHAKYDLNIYEPCLGYLTTADLICFIAALMNYYCMHYA